MKLGNLKNKISTWYNGQWYKNNPNDNFFYFGKVYKPSAIKTRKVVSYLKNEHRFIIGTVLTVVGLLVALSKI